MYFIYAVLIAVHKPYAKIVLVIEYLIFSFENLITATILT